MTENETKRIHATIHGRVQGVGFRAYTYESANRLELTGWVRNRYNGTVETVAEGTQTALDVFLKDLQRGNGPSNVTKVDSNWQTATGEFNKFRIRMTV
ncbi:MAG TPA: acylphosphatase [Anaerolineales bacterium]|nr:acylphosphatase [Anaerolineales bacterium]